MWKRIASKICGLQKRRIDFIKTLYYSKKWPSATKGRCIVAKKTYVDASRNGLKRYGEVHIGCPKGIFGNIAIPGREATMIKIDGNGELYLQDGVFIYAGVRIIVADKGRVTIGENTSIAANTYILSRNEISIGNDCAISWDCQIMDSDFHEILYGNEAGFKDAPIIIGDHVLICSKVTILKGVRIGDNVVVAANSVVTKDIPAGCVAAGNPAMIVKKNVNWL